MKQNFKNQFIIASVFIWVLLAHFDVQSQAKLDIFEAKKVTWYGLDFTQAKMVGRFSQFLNAGEKGGSRIKDTYFNAWNNVILAESDKYNLEETFHVDKVLLNLDSVRGFNAKVDENQLMSSSAINTDLTMAQIQSLTKRYANVNVGIGILFIVEKFDKNENLGVVDVVYFDELSGDVLFAKRMFGKSGGFGIKNYWIRSVGNIMEDIARNKWIKWKKMAAKEEKTKAKATPTK